MRLMRLPLATVTLVLVLSGVATVPGTVRAENALVKGVTMRMISRLTTQYLLLMVRTFVDLTYEHLTIDPNTGEIVITGIVLRPVLQWDPERRCEVLIGRIASSDEIGLDLVESRMELSGVIMAQACLESETAAMMAAFGYEGLTLDHAAVDMSYEFGSSAVDLTLHAAMMDIAVVTVTAAFDYVWISGMLPEPGYPEGNPRPVAKLAEAEIALENQGLFERLEPMITARIGDDSAIPSMVQAMLMQMISDGVSAPDARAMAFLNNVAAEMERFVTERNHIVLSVAPPEPVWLTADLLAKPADAIAALNAKVSLAPLASRALIAPDELARAIGSDAAALDADTAMKVGGAMVTGIGAPRSVAQGRALLEPLVEGWHAGAALLLADAMIAQGEPGAAYGMALRASAGGESRGITLAERLEERLTADVVLAAQAEATAAWPGGAARQETDAALIEAADIGGMRVRAQSAAAGRDMPRSYAEAYYWASLAAAAGDRSSAGLRERLDRRFARTEGAARDAWNGTALAMAGKAVETWTAGGLGARVAALYGLAQ